MKLFQHAQTPFKIRVLENCRFVTILTFEINDVSDDEIKVSRNDSTVNSIFKMHVIFFLLIQNFCMSFLVCIIMAPPLGLIITEITLQNIITVLCCYVIPKSTLLCSLIITLITRILDAFMFRSVMYHHIIFPHKHFSAFWALSRLGIT